MKYLSLIIFSLVFSIPPVYASEVTGTITTGVDTGVEGIVVEAPTANPPAGEYTSEQSVALSGGTGTVSIHYTTDGAAATCSSGNVYSTPITVSSSLVIEAISCYANSIVSPIAIFGYAINPPSAPAPSSGGGGGGSGGFITTPATAAYDFNTDGKVDVFDFNVLITNWGSTGASSSTGDANGDGNVDILDFNLLIINWKP
ncbi:hypothetical protein BK006_02895 [bacterium CG10_49_38]|nr:MAG: hypothetical protein BK006_02895 [bacterium CG10_49_38]